MGNGEEYIWKPPEKSNIHFLQSPSLENDHNKAETKEVIVTNGYKLIYDI